MSDNSPEEYGVDANEIWLQFADILQEHDISAGNPVKAIFVVGAVLGMAGKAIDTANGTDEALDSIMQVAKQVYEQTKLAPGVGIG